nr:MAG TPA: PRTRC system protein E [Caudoviricetes sp.]
MFAALHALAQKSTLMIVLSTEGDLLRLNIAPAPNDESEQPSIRPLSLLATPEELDRDLITALQIWQAPRKSLLEQAADAAAQPDDSTASDAEGDTGSKSSNKAASAKDKAPAGKKGKAKAETKKAESAGVKLLPSQPWPFPGTEATPGDSANSSPAPPTDPAPDSAAVPATAASVPETTPPAPENTTSVSETGAPVPEPQAAAPAAVDTFTIDMF